jgi:hypothetical protein
MATFVATAKLSTVAASGLSASFASFTVGTRPASRHQRVEPGERSTTDRKDATRIHDAIHNGR